jgi:hypothetical protein
VFYSVDGTSVWTETQPSTKLGSSLRDDSVSTLLRTNAASVEKRLGKPTHIDGHRWTYETPAGTLRVYFNDVDAVNEVQPGVFDLSIFPTPAKGSK